MKLIKIDKKKKYLIIFICVVILIIAVFIASVIKNSNKTSNQINNASQVNDVNNSNSIYENTQEDVENLSSEERAANQAYKTSLTDHDWLKSNILIKKDTFGKDINLGEEQKIEFIKFTGDDFSVPSLVVVNTNEISNVTQCYFLKYKDGNVETKSLTSGPDSATHTEYTIYISKNIIGRIVTYYDSTIHEYYKVTENGFEALDVFKVTSKIVNGSEVITYLINSQETTESIYNEKLIEYTPQTARSAEFEEVNTSNLNRNFPY